MGELHFHPNSEEIKPEPIIHSLLDRKDKIKHIFSVVEYDDGKIEFIHSTMRKRDLCYYKDIIANYVRSKLP